MNLVSFSPLIKVFKTQHRKTCARPLSCLFTCATIDRLNAFILRTIDACALGDLFATIDRSIVPGEVDMLSRSTLIEIRFLGHVDIAKKVAVFFSSPSTCMSL